MSSQAAPRACASVLRDGIPEHAVLHQEAKVTIPAATVAVARRPGASSLRCGRPGTKVTLVCVVRPWHCPLSTVLELTLWAEAASRGSKEGN